MRITLNGFELSRQADGQTPVGHVLVEIKEEIARGGKVVGGIRLDGAPLPQGWQRRRRLAQPVSMFNSLDLLITDVDELKRDTLRNTDEMLRQMTAQAQPLALHFRLGDEVTANTELATMLDNLKLVMGGLDHTSRGTNGPNATSFIRERVEQAAQQFLPALDRIYKAQAAGDYISIADELEYELPDHLTTWKSLVGELQAAQPPMSQPVNA